MKQFYAHVFCSHTALTPITIDQRIYQNTIQSLITNKRKEEMRSIQLIKY